MSKLIAIPVTMAMKQRGGLRQCRREFYLGNVGMIRSVQAEGEKYGYLIQQKLRECSDGQADPKGGTLYPLLQRLEIEKLIRSGREDETGQKRKWYSLTAKRKKRLQARAEEWFQTAACLNKLLAPVVKIAPEPA